MLGFPGSSSGLDPILTIGGAPDNIDLTTVNQVGTIPTLDDGSNPDWVLLPNATESCQFNLGNSAAVDSKVGPILSAMDWVVFATRGRTHYAASVLSGTFADFTVLPLAGFNPRRRSSGCPIADGSSVSLVLQTGVTTEIAIPTLRDGKRARYVLISGDNQSYFKPGFTGESIHGTPPTHGLRVKGNCSYCINVTGYTHIIATAGTGTGRALYVMPMEV